MTNSTDHLKKASAAIGDDDHGAALRHLLAAWQITPASELADAIEVVGARAAEGLPTPTGKTVAERNATWTKLAKAGDPVIRGPLVNSLAEINSFPGLTERIAILAATPDPRVARRIGDLVENAVFSPTIGRHAADWRALWKVLATLGDPRILPRVGGFTACWKKTASKNQQVELARGLRNSLPALTAAYGGGVPRLAARAAASVKAIAAKAALPTPAVVAGKRSEAELLAAIYATPGDAGPRAVYADFLQERGNPRGEFIALQLATERTVASRARERELLAEYVERWVEPLHIKKATARFERGFVVACEVGRESALATNPAWSTVRTITNADSAAIVALAKRSPPLALEALVWEGPDSPTSRTKLDRAAMTAWPKLALPELRRLTVGMYDWLAPTVTATQLAWLLRAPCIATLDELTLFVSPALAPAFLATLASTAIRRFEVCCRLYNQTIGWRMAFERDAANAFTQLTIHVDPNPPDWPHNTTTWGGLVVAAIPTLRLTSARVVVAKRSAADFTKHVKKRLVAAFAEHGNVKPVFA